MIHELNEYTEKIATEIVDIAFKIHKKLGPGLLESIYEKCFCYELKKRGIQFIKHKNVEIIYEGILIDEGLRIDILVDDLIVIELKAQENSHPIWEAQLLSYLKLTEKELGFLINFHVKIMKNGIKRMIHTQHND